jgi:hypothetical protein
MFEKFGNDQKFNNNEVPMNEEKTMGEVVSFGKKEKVDEFAEKVAREKQEAKELFQDLIDAVNKRYENLPEKMREDFIAHNEELLGSVIELGIEKGFDAKELKALEMAAIWHDAAKADAVGEEFKDVPNYALIIHGEKAANEVSLVLTGELLAKNGFAEDEFEQVRKTVSDAILQHMGPHPGFMTAMLEGANKKLREMGKPEIVHPKAEGKISEALLAADMRSLAGEKGRKKILTIRASVPKFIDDDIVTSDEYRSAGINLSPAEAALLSGFDSAENAVNMISDGENKAWIAKAFEESKTAVYVSVDGKQEMTWSDINTKRNVFNAEKDLNKNTSGEFQEAA